MRLWLLLAAVTVSLTTSLADAQSIRLNSRSPLDTRDMESSEIFQSLYRGRFDDLRSRRGFVEHIFPYAFVHSATGYATVCPGSIAPDSPSIRVTAMEKDGWGNVIHTNTQEYRVDRRFAEKARAYGVPHSRNPMGYELLTLFRRNGCDSAHVRQFLENVLRFAYGRPPVQAAK